MRCLVLPLCCTRCLWTGACPGLRPVPCLPTLWPPPRPPQNASRQDFSTAEWTLPVISNGSASYILPDAPFAGLRTHQSCIGPHFAARNHGLIALFLLMTCMHAEFRNGQVGFIMYEGIQVCYVACLSLKFRFRSCHARGLSGDGAF